MIAIDLVERHSIRGVVFEAHLGGKMVRSAVLSSEDAREFDCTPLAAVLADDYVKFGYSEPLGSIDHGANAIAQRMWLTRAEAEALATMVKA